MTKVISILLVILTIIGCSPSKMERAGTISDVDFEVGMTGLVTAKDPIQMSGITVHLLRSLNGSDTTSSQDIDSTFTDSTGKFHFDSLTAGVYHIRSRSGDSLSGVKRNIQYDTGHVQLSPLALQKAGAIHGKVTSKESNHAGTLVYLPGTSYNAFTDSAGEYTISNVAPYSNYYVAFSRYGYASSVTYGVTVYPEVRTEIEQVILTPNLYPQNLRATLDAEKRIVTVQWDPMEREDVLGYILMRGDSSLMAKDPVQLNSEMLITGTSFTDTLDSQLFSYSDTITVFYQLKGKTAQESTPNSQPVYVRCGIHPDSFQSPKIHFIDSGIPDSVTPKESLTLEWTNRGIIDSVSIEFSNNNGQNWIILEKAIPNNHSYEWNAFDISADRCRFRVSNVEDPKNFAISTTSFTITRDTDEMIRNGDFSEGLSNSWSFVIPHPDKAEGKISTANNVAEISVISRIADTTIKTFDYFVRLAQTNLTVLPYETYQLIFDHKVSEARALGISLQHAEAPWFVHDWRTFTSDTLWQRDTLEISAKEHDTNALIAFECAGDTGSVWIDNVSLKQL